MRFVPLALLLLAAPASAASIVGGSDLFTPTSAAQVESWLVNDPQLSYNGSLIFNNVFDKASGNTSLDFHTAADGKGPTVTLYEATANLIGGGSVTYIVGGFNPQSWNVTSPSLDYYNLTSNIADRIAFIFNLSTGDRRDQQIVDINGTYQTYNHPAVGPAFGGGVDLFVGSDLTSGGITSYTYCTNILTNCLFELALFGLIVDSSITVNRLEVFTITDTQTPLPGALALFPAGLGLLGWLGMRRRRAARAILPI